VLEDPRLSIFLGCKILVAEHGIAAVNGIEKAFLDNGSQTAETNESTKEFAKQLTEKLERYVAELFAPGTGSVKVQSPAESDVITVQILGTKDASRNYLSVNWSTEWRLHLQSEFVEASGAFKLHVHCWEEGNTQLESSCTFRPSKLHGNRDSETEKLVDKIYWKIRDGEDAVQVRLNESYARTTEQALKRLRRQLPVTRTKMDWNKFAGYKLSSELGPSKA
jgi:capping protein alpha